MSYKEYPDLAALCSDQTKEDELYLENEDEKKSLQDIIEAAKKHFGGKVSLDDLIITPAYEQFRCHGYDCYDPCDYGNVLIIYPKAK